MSAISNQKLEINALSRLVETLTKPGKGNSHRRTYVIGVFDQLSGWESVHAGGHRTFKSRATGAVVGCQGHGKDPTIPRNQVKAIAEVVSKHLQLLKAVTEEKNQDQDTKKRKH